MRLLWIPLAMLLLAGCVVVPLAPRGYAPPRPRATYIHPAPPIYPYWSAPRHAPRYYHRGRG